MDSVDETQLKAAGFVEVRSGKGGHRLLKHPTTGIQ